MEHKNFAFGFSPNGKSGHIIALPVSVKYCISYRNQSFDLQSESNDWFLYGMQHWAEMA